MKKSFVLLIALLLILAGCKDHKETIPPEIAEVLQLKVDRPLEVVLVSPQEQTSGPKDYEAVTVVFNQPMKALTAEAPENAQPFQLDPPAKGRFRWKGTATVSFEPSEPLKFGTEYTVKVAKGIKSSAGNVLEADHISKFTTPAPSVIKTIPENHTKGWKGDKPLIYIFDQDVKTEDVQAKLSYTYPENIAPPKARRLTTDELEKLNADRPKEDPYLSERLVALETTDLKPKTMYSVKIDKGIRSAEGPGTSKDAHVLLFTSLGPLEWTGTRDAKTHSPGRSIYFTFSNSVNAKKLKEHITIQPKVDIPVNSYDQNDAWSRHNFYLALEPNTDYKVKIDGKLTDIHGQALGKDVEFVWKTGDKRPIARIADGLAVLEAEGPLSIPMGFQNIDSVTTRMSVLDRQQVATLLTSDDSSWLWGSKKFSPPEGFQFTETTKPSGPRNELSDHPLDLTKVLKNRKHGFVYYQVVSKAGDRTYNHRGLAQVTNLGATGKFSAENSVFFATQLDNADILEGVEATILDAKGRPIWQGSSEANGLIQAPGWSELVGTMKDQYSLPPLILVLKKDDDEVFIRNGGFGGLSPWMFDVSFRWRSSIHQLKSQIYSERGLYRPGEEVHLKGALRDREDGQWVLPQVSKLNFIVKNSRDEKLSTGKVEIGEFGTFHHTVQIPEKAPTGSYSIDYKLAPKKAKEWGLDEYVRGASFRVEEFEPAQFEVDVTSEHKALVMGGDKAKFKISGNWLFGSPMQSEKVRWSSRIVPSTFLSKNHPGYDFGPGFYSSEEDPDSSLNLTAGTGTTDVKGLFEGQTPTGGISFRGDGQLIIEGTVTSANRRSITGAVSIPVSRGEYRIGLQPASRFVPSAQAVTVKAVTLSPEGKNVEGESFILELVRREWNSVRKADADGRYRWITEIEDKVVETQQVKTEDKETTLSFTPPEAGFYLLRAKGTDSKKNPILTQSYLYAHGSGYVPWGRGDDEAIELVADKPSYAPGETAQILIKNPYEEATALVTYERDLVLHSYTTKLQGSAPVIEVPLTEEHLPNLYVSVMLFRGRVDIESEDPSEDIGKPGFKIGYLDIPVTPDSKRLKVEISTDRERYGPKDEVVTKLKVTNADGQPVRAELSLTAADVGVLNLINYQTPDLFDTFYGSIPLGVRTAESRLDVIGQRSYGTKGEDEGGGGGYNPGFRSDFKLTALWEPNVVTDGNGEAEVRFKMPENLTTFRVMATAITGDTRCGSADREIILTKPLILKPSTPAFARLGDKFKAGVLAVNGTKETQKLTVSLEAEGIDSKAAPQEVTLKAGEEREILFELMATLDGTATLRFSGVMGDEKDGVQFELPLQQAVQRVNLSHAGSTTEKSFEQPIEVASSAKAGTATVEVKLDNTILRGLDQSVKSLLDYPYGCLEQRLSKATPLLLAEGLVNNLELKGWKPEKVKAHVQATINKIPGYAHHSGGLKVWPDGKHAHPFLTARAMRFASIAKKKGYKVEGPWVDKCRGYLKKYLAGDFPEGYHYSKTEILVTQAAALDALTRFGFSGESYLNNLMDKRQKMSAVGKAYLLEAAIRLDVKSSVETLKKELTNSLKIENATAYFDVDASQTPWLFASDVRDSGLILNALLAADPKFPVADKVVTWLLEARKTDGTWGNTANNAAALTGLLAYSEAFESDGQAFEVQVKLDKDDLGTAKLATESQNSEALSKELKPGQKSKLSLSKSGEQRVYYNVNVSYQDTEPSPPVDEGMTMVRTLTDTEGRPVTKVKGGEMYRVNLAVIAPSLRRYVALRDPIPAGFTVVKTDFATESSELSKLLQRGKQPSWQTFFRFEDYNDKVLLFADALAPGEHTYQYLVRAQTPGTYLYPAAQVEEMYHPEVFGRTGESQLVIE